ncbi:MAG: hypothetical protein WBK43_11375 [Prolixibacteraceae bacterium]|jgi:hypothetical protein|nr:hypothetical protein [Bacteroidota bacterium]OQB78548.1 MAG: hypothetical protein BWX87_02674 [Bacteroidetes bacterium ADurb.Bin123]HOC87862.1 hypothetical protein [Prolixibacteraceae bacterium]HOG97217.1 hypothetical protein [Prolixibacteraceae bacterium]HPY28990.1 hypothetical protein [Prolixibacteraceae bacterium]
MKWNIQPINGKSSNGPWWSTLYPGERAIGAKLDLGGHGYFGYTKSIALKSLFYT